ncbi:uncharacterized protein LOC124885572 [Capsicum annuum]|uniref:uncharacterized protein LOC124885572 n=1 Tax=Capsicum annuum TaxID=4072 RepID=UPI001FB06998|nr:uncharacterized protein LOC124885572 [Capsicum annuum]
MHGLPIILSSPIHQQQISDGHLADRVGDGVPRILKSFVKYRPTYKEIKPAFFYIRKEQVVLRSITLTVLEKIILQLPHFKSVDAVVHFIDLPSTGKQDCSHSSSDNELELLRSDVKVAYRRFLLIFVCFC